MMLPLSSEPDMGMAGTMLPLSFEPDMGMDVLKPGHLCFPTQHPHKTRPANISSCIQGRTHKASEVAHKTPSPSHKQPMQR